MGRRWEAFVRWFTVAPLTTFSEDTPRPVDQLILEMQGGTSNPRVSRTDALSVSSVLRGRNLICSISTLPLIQLGPDRSVVRHPLLEQINPNVPNVHTLSYTVEDLLFEGIAWWRITEQQFDGYPMSAERIEPSRVSIEESTGEIWIDGKRVSPEVIIRFDSPNPPLLKVGGRAIRRAILLDKAAGLYADDPRPLDYFSPNDGADPIEDEDVRVLLRQWECARKERATAYVPAALKYNPVDTPSPADLRLPELQKQATLDIANALGLDPEDLGISTTSRTYQNAVDRRQDRINDVLSPYMRAITDRLSMGDVTKRGYRVMFDLDDYMRADPKTRWEVYEKAHALGAITTEEIREEEKMPPLPANAPRPVTTLRPANAIAASANGVSLKLSGDSVNLQLDDVEVTGFAVDIQARTITGLAVPYNRVAVRDLRRWRFAAGSLKWSDVGRVKLLRDHDRSQAIGRAIELTETPEGLAVKFRIARNAAGDEALALAEDGVLDGLSVGVNFDLATDTVPDPENKGVTLVRRADLREVSLTAMPAFDDSRVTSVAASADEGNSVTETTEPTTAPAVPAGAPDMTAFNAFVQAFQNVQTPPEEPGRQIINPANTATTFVSEPQPYRFDSRGNIQKGTHDFSTDLIAGSKGDTAALERAQNFVIAQFDVDKADAATLNPNRQRPDMYVDQREYRYPVWQSISKGTLADSTPFVFPKFNTSSGLVANHTEGVEPTPGTFTATSQTVTPTAVSGKVEITREAWDQGGNPQLSNLIWRQMTRAYFEALEAAAVAVLDAATPTAIALTAGGGTTGQTLAQELFAAFASLQYVRGGFSMDTMFAQIDLYKALVAARDGQGRPLFPALGPTNADGTVRSRFGAVDVNGVLALPAWALAATGSVVASSYLFDSEVVHGWATAPQRLQFEYRVAYVDLAIWGYKATAISDITGVREITYDPVP